MIRKQNESFLAIDVHWFGRGALGNTTKDLKSDPKGPKSCPKCTKALWPNMRTSLVVWPQQGPKMLQILSRMYLKNYWADFHDSKPHKSPLVTLIHRLGYFTLKHKTMGPQNTQKLCWGHIDGLVQERRNSIANALEFSLSCTNPSISSRLLPPARPTSYFWMQGAQTLSSLVLGASNEEKTFM